MKTLLYFIFGLCALFIGGCKASSHLKPKPKPEWVNNRPVNPMYYIGIGIASKQASPTEYQQVAKRNALSDLISEMKVTVSANSVLSQYQKNQDFTQQFESQTKLDALNTIESYEIVDSWEDKENFWVYYRLSKEEYRAEQRRKMQVAIDKAEDYYNRAQQLDLSTGYLPAIRFKMLALKEVQGYLNDDLQSVVNGKEVYLVNELLSSLQSQLSDLSLLLNRFTPQNDSSRNENALAVAMLRGVKPVANVPVCLIPDKPGSRPVYATQSDGAGLIHLPASLMRPSGNFRNLKLMFDLPKVVSSDSFSPVLKQILFSLIPASTPVPTTGEPLKIYFRSEELNLSRPLATAPLESLLKRKLTDDGCIFVSTPVGAAYTIVLKANTRSLGQIYKNTQSVALDFSVSLKDNLNQVEVYTDSKQDIKGFQSTPETAGLEAYRKAGDIVGSEIYTELRRFLTGQ